MLADQPAVAHGPHVQGTTPADDQVGVFDELRRGRRGETAGDPQRECLALEQPIGDRGGRDQRAGLLGQRQQLRLGGSPAAPGNEDGALRGPDPIGQREDGLVIRTDRQRSGRRIDSIRRRIGDLVLLHIDGKAEHHHAAFVHRRAIGADGVRQGAAGRVHALRNRTYAHRQGILVHPEIGLHRRPRALRGQDEHRGAALCRLPDASHGVGQATALVGGQHAEGVRHPGVGVGHAGRTALVPGGGERHPVASQRIRDDQVSAAHHPEGVSDTELSQGAADEFGDIHAAAPCFSTSA